MGDYVASEIVKYMIRKNISVNRSNILILGITFKENCPDVRNTKVIDVVSSLKEFGTNITVCDPWADPEELINEYDLVSSKKIPNEKFDAIVLTVAHDTFLKLDLNSYRKDNSVIYDVKGVLKNCVDGSL